MPDSDSKVHGASMGPIWGRQDPGGPHVGPMNFAIWEWYGWKSDPWIVFDDKNLQTADDISVRWDFQCETD